MSAIPTIPPVRPNTDIKGDFNMDGVADAKDVELFKKYLDGTEAVPPGVQLDQNGDGVVDQQDLALVTARASITPNFTDASPNLIPPGGQLPLS